MVVPGLVSESPKWHRHKKKLNLWIFLYNLADLQLYIFLDRDLHSVLAVCGDAGGAGAGPGVP